MAGNVFGFRHYSIGKNAPAFPGNEISRCDCFQQEPKPHKSKLCGIAKIPFFKKTDFRISEGMGSGIPIKFARIEIIRNRVIDMQGESCPSTLNYCSARKIPLPITGGREQIVTSSKIVFSLFSKIRFSACLLWRGLL
ncbi:MAG: hypothetical protein LUC98_13125 [Lachnospiraceae bacterium]|nr:hypothetical protein [Lachnospiraceae bacterium]